VAIRGEPTGGDFHTETVHVLLREEDGVARWRMLRWGSHLPSAMRVCPGRITLCDRDDRRAVFFSFGGSLEAIVAPEVAIYEVRSPVPILGITVFESPASEQLAGEVEAVMAEVETKWGSDKEFSRRLAQIEPLDFYLAVLQSLHSRFEHSRALQESSRNLYNTIHREREWFTGIGQWPSSPITAEELLSPR